MVIHCQLNNQDLETCDDWKEFSHHVIGDEMFLVIASLATKNIPLPIV
jgi:hypothetical protein